MGYFDLKDNFARYKHVKSDLIQGIQTDKIPLVSIVIPTFHRVDTLKIAIDSALQQKDFDDYVVIVVDNDPERGTETEMLIERYLDERLYYYKNQENLGMIGNWNRCIELVNSKWITLLHDDDILLPNFLGSMFRVIGESTEIEFLISEGFICNNEQIQSLCIDNLNHKDGIVSRISTKRYVVNNIACAPGLLMKKDNIIFLGGFNDEYFPVTDYVLWLNYHLQYGSYYLHEKLWIYRTGEGNASRDVAKNIIMKSAEIKIALSKKIDLNVIERYIKLKLGQGAIINGYKNYLDDEQYEHLLDSYATKSRVMSLFYRIINRLCDLCGAYR